MATTPAHDDRHAQLQAAKRRLLQLEAETHRLRAELSRLEAAGEDAAAQEIEAELRRQETDLGNHRLSVVPFTPRSPDFSNAASFAAAEDAPPTPVVIPQTNPTPKGKSNHAAGTRRSKTSPWRRPPALIVSLGVHALVVLMLGATGFATLVDAPDLLLASSVTGEEELLDELTLTEVDFEEIADEDFEFDEVTTELDAIDANEIELNEADAPWADVSAEAITPVAFDAPPSDIGSLLTVVEQAGRTGQVDGAGRGGESSKAGGAPRGGARFFGARSKGGRFVFVVDNSGSMRDGRLETTLMEIQRSVGQMSADQSFHVVFYSDQAYPMFFPESTDKLKPATRENKRKLAAWLSTVEMCVGGRLRDAMKLAESMRPDTVFLLSDGGMGSGTMRYMTEDSSGWPFVINTLGMTVKKPEHAQNLLAIADAHNGLFYPVGINPAAALQSERRPIKYNSTVTGPGLVWGTKVKKSR